MTPLPKKKHTKSRRGKRLAKNRMSIPNLSVCVSCHKLKLPHIKCPHCGYYHRSTNQA